MRSLRFCMRSSYELGEKDHPQKVMEKLGIGYEQAEPAPIADCWIFYNCTNLPEILPSYLTYSEAKPHES